MVGARGFEGQHPIEITSESVRVESAEVTECDGSGPDWLIPTTIAVRPSVSASIGVGVHDAGVIDAIDSRDALDAVTTSEVGATMVESVSSPPRTTTIRLVTASVDAAGQVDRERSPSARSDLVRALVDASTRAAAMGDTGLLRVALDALGRLAKPER